MASFKNSESTVPSFVNPPVVETVLGIEFDTPKSFASPYFGIFWERIREAFPISSVHPPLAPSNGKPDGSSGSLITVKIGTPPSPRHWYENEKKDALVQLQEDRLVYNWRKSKDAGEYPRYEEVIKPAFVGIVSEFNQFLVEQKFGELEVKQCEVTYVNHIEKGAGWENFSDLNNIFCPFSEKADWEFLPKPENVTFSITYPMSDSLGKISFSATPGVRKSDGHEIIQLNVSAIGTPTKPDLQSAIDWIDLGHSWVVHGFTDFTTVQMHQLWEREMR